MKEISLEVITPSIAAYNKDVISVTVPGTVGNFQILFNHAPIISSLEIGIVKINENADTEKFFAISGGTVEVLNNKVLIFAESFEAIEDIDVERAKAALKRAKERLQSKDKDVDQIRAEVALKRAINRLKLADKYQPA